MDHTLNFNSNEIPDWLYTGKLLGYAAADSFTSDRYRFEISEVEYDLDHHEISRTTKEMGVIVFPFNKEENAYTATSDVAAYIEDGDSFNCHTSPPHGKKSFSLKLNKEKTPEFIISGRWKQKEFVSSATTMLDIGENFQVDRYQEKNAGNGEGILRLHYKGQEIFVMPILYNNQNGHAPFVAILRKDGSEDLVVGATQTELHYDDIHLGCYWDDTIFKCYSID